MTATATAPVTATATKTVTKTMTKTITKTTRPGAVLLVLIMLTQILCAQAPDRRRNATPGPGYYGTWPSARGQQILQDLVGSRLEDSAGRFGVRGWKLAVGGIVPHPLGPGRHDVIELRSTRTKGPHVTLSRGKCAFFLPTRCDGDVAALLTLLGRPVDEQLQPGRVSQEWQEAMSRIDGLGMEQYGVRIGVVPGAAKNSIDVLIWNVSDRLIVLEGDASLQVDRGPRVQNPVGPRQSNGLSLPLSLLWPPQVNSPEGRSYVRLEPGSVYEQRVELGALAVQGHKLELAKAEQLGLAKMREFSVCVRIESIGHVYDDPRFIPAGNLTGRPLRSATRLVKLGEVASGGLIKRR